MMDKDGQVYSEWDSHQSMSDQNEITKLFRGTNEQFGPTRKKETNPKGMHRYNQNSIIAKMVVT
jgi:hypothetical protein